LTLEARATLPVQHLLTEAQDALRDAPRRAARLARAALELSADHPRAMHLLGEALSRTGAPAQGARLLRAAVRADGNLAELAAPGADRADGPAWIGRFEAVACPVCASSYAAPIWAGNLSRSRPCHGHLDPVRVWVRCEDCGVARVEAPVPPAALRAWQATVTPPPADPPPASGDLSERLLAHDALIGRIREEGYGRDWIDRAEGGPPQPALLEIGCGWGDLLSAAQWRGFSVVGVDVDRRKADWASRRLGVEVHAADFARGVPEGPFDVVVVRAPLGLQADPVRALQGLARQLAPDGLLVLQLHTLDHPVHLMNGADDPLWSDPARRTWFSRESLTPLLDRADLTPVSASYAPNQPGAATIFARLSPAS
jgi:SAM-dependent methyltransferase